MRRKLLTGKLGRCKNEKKIIFPTKEELTEERNDFLERRKPRKVVLKRIRDRLNNNYAFCNSEILDRDGFLKQIVIDLNYLCGCTRFIIREIIETLGDREACRILDALHNKKKIDVCLSINLLKSSRVKIKRALRKRNWEFADIPWFEDGITTTAYKDSLVQTSEYKRGQFTIPEYSSFMLPVMALAPSKDENIATIGSSADQLSYIASLMKCTGKIYANVLSQLEYGELVLAIQRLGVTNTDVSVHNMYKPLTFRRDNLVKKILLFAPSTKTGCFDKDLFCGTSKEILQGCVELQKKLLLEAIDMIDIGGYVVYATMSLLVQENEEVINFALKEKKDMRIVPLDHMAFGHMRFGRPGITHRRIGFHQDLKYAKRFYPHVNNLDVMFLAKLEKVSN